MLCRLRTYRIKVRRGILWHSHLPLHLIATLLSADSSVLLYLYEYYLTVQEFLESSSKFWKILEASSSLRIFLTIQPVEEYSRRLLSNECKSRIFSKTGKFQNIIVLITRQRFSKTIAIFYLLEVMQVRIALQ